jgi:hypothetical protein
LKLHRDGDGEADIRKKLFTGFGMEKAGEVANNLVYRARLEHNGVG